ncbi:MAG: arsenate reductase family protein [Ruminococcaceae bacterium]|nr:arsenate reductase family protein [Oscillospiraceae bacterium]
MTLTFVCYPKCSTCQKAAGWLKDRGIECRFRDIRTERPSREELAVWRGLSGLPLKKFFNTSGLFYKSMDLKNKLPGMSEEEMLDLLASDGMLVKRPILVGEGFVLVGFREAEWAEAGFYAP